MAPLGNPHNTKNTSKRYVYFIEAQMSIWHIKGFI